MKKAPTKVEWASMNNKHRNMIWLKVGSSMCESAHKCSTASWFAEAHTLLAANALLEKKSTIHIVAQILTARNSLPKGYACPFSSPFYYK